MKRLVVISTAIASLLGLWACGGSKDNPEPEQSSPTDITLSDASISAEQAGGVYSLTVKAPSRPSIEHKLAWVTVKDGIYNRSTYTITYKITVDPNLDYQERTGEVVVKSGTLSKSLTITQAPRVKPSMPDTDIATSLVTSGATAEAKALYDFLLSQYGKKTVSAIMANVNWNHDEADKVYAATGKYPAMNCYDFIHILYSGANWINYSDLKPVTEWADAGGIVSLMWHFNVPKSEGAGTSEVTCTPSETTFRAKNIFTEGTWERTWFYDQMDKVADVILALQEKKIAALWRPFHEAAGNYYAKKWQGAAWFWWGFDGPEVCKQVWNAMQDYFYEKGIRNLIWVWTAQDYNGDPTSYGSDYPYYPGDDRVDIVGRDIYGKGADYNRNEFVSAQTAYPHKMITLSECGKDNVTEYGLISDVWEAGAYWSWFMPWYGSNMPGTSWWQDALSCENVITRDKVNY